MRRVISVLAFALPLAPSASLHAQESSSSTTGRAYVLIEGPKTATLEILDGATFRAICTAPCDRAFPIGRTYRVAGEDVHASDPFVLAGSPGSTVTLKVDDTKHHTGGLVTQGGVLVTLVGGFAFFGGAFGSCSEGNLGDACNSYRWLTITGGVLVVAGIATIVTGIVLMAQGSHAQIEQVSGQITPKSGDQASSSRVVWPSFDATKPLTPSAPTSPVLSFSF